MKKILFGAIFAMFTQQLFAQSWVEMAREPNANLYDIQKEFNTYFEDKDIDAKGNGYKQFKRWEYMVSPRVYPSGDLSLMKQTAKNYADFLRDYTASQSINKSTSVASATWVPVGPMGAPTGSLNGVPMCAGRDNFVTFHPSNPLKLYAGSASGGLWETSNGGTTWSTYTDNQPVLGGADLVIDPTNNNIMYLATSGGDDFFNGGPVVSSDGVYKSTDGGLTWQQTGLAFAVSQNRFIHKLVLDPTNPQIIFAATSIGVQRSTNGGTTWASVQSGNIWDLKFHPTNPTIVYASGNVFYRSTNGGTSFSQVSTGIPTGGVYRMSIAVTPTNPSYVYVLACKSSDYQFLGLYKSTNDGVSFTTASSSPNVIGNACNGTSTGAGTGWYNLSIAASPTTPNEIAVGGVNVWRSTNGGTNWSNIGCWVGTGSPPFVHADIHELEYSSNGTLYSSNDGGLFYYTGSSWTNITGQRNIAQIYKIGLSTLTPNLWITGHQDNGTSVYNGTNYFISLGGDGMDCFIDRTNNNNMFAEQYNGSLRRSTNGGLSWSSITTGITGTGAWVTPWKQDPVNPTTLYCGRNQLFRSTNLGSSWTQAGTAGGSGSMVEFAIAPSNNQVIYALYSGSIRKTSNGGTTWSSANFSGGSPTFITIDPSDENTAWVTVSGYTAGNKVFQTTDGGASWTNISSNLPNLPANCSVYEPGTNDRIYIGMDIGIYYKDNSSPNWTLYNAGLPNVMVLDLEISPALPGQLFAATFGRGVYQADVVATTAAPTPSFSHIGSICVGTDEVLVDNSSNTPTSWSWTIVPNTGVTFNSTTVQNPTLSFTSPGTYTISMVSGNSFGMGSTITQTVAVHLTPTLSITVSNSVSVCLGQVLPITASGALTYTWSNGGGNNASVTYTPTIPWTYTLTGSNNGCVSKETVAVSIETCVGINEFGRSPDLFSVYPNPAYDKLTLISQLPGEVIVGFTDVSGKLVQEQVVHFRKEKSDIQLSISSLPKGIYFLNMNSKNSGTQTIKFVKE